MGLIAPIDCGMWSVTPYDKCDFRCLYCCTRVQGTSEVLHSRDSVLAQLRASLEQDIPPGDLVIVGAYCDPYPPPEAQAGLTRTVVEELVRRRRRFVLVTKSTIVAREIDLFPRSEALCTVVISVSSVDEAALRRLDPGAPSAAERFATLRSLYEAGIHCEVNALPWIPGITETAEIIRRVPDDVKIVFAPLSIGKDRDSMALLGTRYGRDEVQARYLEEYRRFGHVPNTSWVRPAPPPMENDPMYRLPVLEPPRPRSPLRRLLAFARH